MRLSTSIARFVTFSGRFILWLMRPYADTFFSKIHRTFQKKRSALPPIKNKLLLISATELAEKIRKRELLSEEVVQTYIDRCREVQPFINALVGDRFDEALEDARKVDKLLDSGKYSSEEVAEKFPLLGVPFSCKDCLGVKGMTQTCGLLREKGRIAVKDSHVAYLYKKAGAIPLVITNVPDKSSGITTVNVLFGRTLNPYDDLREVGGSSGGEAAILSAAGSVIGLGTDLAGSVRIPGSFCGIYSHKPTAKVISTTGMYPQTEENKRFEYLRSPGPMCRYADDLPLLFELLTEKNEALKFREKVDFRMVKIYYMEQVPGTYSACPAVKKAVREAADHFKKGYGSNLTKLDIAGLNAFSILESKLLENNLSPRPEIFETENRKINIWKELLLALFGKSEFSYYGLHLNAIFMKEKDKLYEEMLVQFKKLESKFDEIFKNDSIVLLPTFPELPPYRHLTSFYLKDVAYSGIFNTLGLPATQIPVYMKDGLPVGIQAVSGKFKDHLTIAAALELDQSFGGWKSPSRIQC